jgi:ABC-type Mn2+/Zn2+ transport system ATPase subunit
MKASKAASTAEGTAHDHVCWGCGHDHRAEHHHELAVHELSVSYGDIQALTRIEFATYCGRSLALVGPNGAGKSTLLKTLAGLIPPDGGSIFWRRQPLTCSSHEIAYLPQRGEIDWNFPVTVRGLVEMGRYPNLGWWRSYKKHDADIVERAIEAMDLRDLQCRQISALSGGQQQRVFIARALAQEAHVLLLDEPFAGLDRPAQEALQRLLHELSREGRLIIASHHQLDTVPAIFDDVLLLRREQIAFGPVAIAFTAAALERTYGSDGEEGAA